MKKRTRNKLITLNRAGGATMYIPPAQLQSLFAQTFYGGKTNFPTQDATMFSPGVPLAPQPGVNKAGLPVQWRFPIAANTFPVDRSLGQPDIPSFEQLRSLAKLYFGVTLCERAWFDMVPRLKPSIKLKQEYVAQGVEEKNFRKEITYFLKWFEKPDKKLDIHSWMIQALREQSQIDELYLYKHRLRNGKLLALPIVAGDTMKPLLNDWGGTPLPEEGYAFQQYPWGIPGMQYTMDQMIHFQETPAADTPYGQSRIERVIMIVNMALRKLKKDTSYFTEGNQPFSFMEVPETSQWTPDDIDSFEQSWNALLAGNPGQQVRMKFLQPGMKYIKAEDYQLLSEPDKFLLNVTVAMYGCTMAQFSFTETVNKSSGDSQENVEYRRTIGPTVSRYSRILTDVMNNDFEPSLHGDMFEYSFSGFEESEDLEALAKAYSTLTGAGILGLSAAAKLMKLPEEPDAPHIGRIQMAKDGPIFLDDVASDDMRSAALEAKKAGLELAANPPAPNEQPEEQNGKAAQPQQAKAQKQGSEKATEKSNQARATDQNLSRTLDTVQANDAMDQQERAADFRNWRKRAIEDVKDGRPQRSFSSDFIPGTIQRVLSVSLSRCETVEQVRATFSKVGEMEKLLPDINPLLVYDPVHEVWEPEDVAQQLESLREKGARFLRWHKHPERGPQVCAICEPNDGEIREVGQRFTSGHLLPTCHPHCECFVELLKEMPVKHA